MAIPKHVVSVIVFHPLNNFKGTLATLPLVVSLRVPSYDLQLGVEVCPRKMILAPFHSNSSSHRQTMYNYPRSTFENITKLNDAIKLFNEMTRRQPLPSVVKFNQLLQAVTKMKHYFCAIELFKVMNAICVPVDEYTISIVIKCCCQLYRTSEGFAVLGYGFKRSVSPDVTTFSTLLNGLISEDRVPKAENLFKKVIEEKLCEPNAYMYSTMIKGLCKFGNNDTAIALLKLMEGSGCNPNVVTYSTIIDSLCNDKKVDDALKLFKEMVFHKGILPNVVTYNSLIHGLCNLCRWDEVFKMLKQMEDEKISPNVNTCSILVDAYCKEGLVEHAERVINMMIDTGKDPNVVTYSSLIHGYCLRGEMNKAKEVLDSMGVRGLIPTVVTYNILLNGYCKNLKMEEAMHLFHEMFIIGMRPDLITYHIMKQGFFQVGRKAACKLLCQIRPHSQVPHECTYKLVLEGLCNNNQVDEALSLFHVMGDNKLNSNIYMYNLLIDGASRHGKLNIAKKLFNDLTVKGLQADVKTYNSMISGFCRECLVTEAKELYFTMKETGCLPDSVTYNILLQGLLKNQQHDMIEMLLQEMDGRGFSPDALTLSLLFQKVGIDAACVTV